MTKKFRTDILKIQKMFMFSLVCRELRGKQVEVLHGPATVSEELSSICKVHWSSPGRTEGSADSQVRRPA